MTTAPHPSIRPTLDALRDLPTLRQERRVLDGVEGVLDLKLESDERRYWICSSATVLRPGAAVPPELCTDNVTMEVFNPEAEEWDAFVYSPDRTKELQMVDYFQVLGRRLDELLSREAPDSIVDTRREIEELRSEFLALRKLWGEGQHTEAKSTTRTDYARKEGRRQW
jgi:hypothetical protein